MKTLQLKKYQVGDLAAFLNSLKPADLGELKSIRKVSRAIDVLEGCVKSYNDQFQVIRDEAKKFIDEQQAPLIALDEKIKAEQDPVKKSALSDERKKLQEEVQKGIGPFNDKIKALKDGEGQVDVACELDGNDHAEVCSQFKKHAATRYVINKEYLAAADALGIEE